MNRKERERERERIVQENSRTTSRTLTFTLKDPRREKESGRKHNYRYNS